jgi:hypothetical protein
MNPLLCTSIDPGYPDFARSCMIIHDIDMGLAGSGVSIDADLCVNFASTLNPKNYRYGIIDFPEIRTYLDTCTLAQAESAANDFADAIRSLSSAYPSVKWCLAQTLSTFPFENNNVIDKKNHKNFVSSKTNLNAFVSILVQASTWMCVDFRPDSSENMLSGTNRILLAGARVSCGTKLAAMNGWNSGVMGCVGNHVWDPRSSMGYLDNQYPMGDILVNSQGYGLSGLLHYHPASVVWRIHADQPAQDTVNGITDFSDMFDFNSAKSLIESQCNYVGQSAPLFKNLSKNDPREIVLSKVINELSGSGDMNSAEHVWHKINRSINAKDYWVNKADIPPRPNPVDFS